MFCEIEGILCGCCSVSEISPHVVQWQTELLVPIAIKYQSQKKGVLNTRSIKQENNHPTKPHRLRPPLDVRAAGEQGSRIPLSSLFHRVTFITHISQSDT